jgi:hypothetical protein
MESRDGEERWEWGPEPLRGRTSRPSAAVCVLLVRTTATWPTVYRPPPTNREMEARPCHSEVVVKYADTRYGRNFRFWRKCDAKWRFLFLQLNSGGQGAWRWRASRSLVVGCRQSPVAMTTQQEVPTICSCVPASWEQSRRMWEELCASYLDKFYHTVVRNYVCPLHLAHRLYFGDQCKTNLSLYMFLSKNVKRFSNRLQLICELCNKCAWILHYF